MLSLAMSIQCVMLFLMFLPGVYSVCQVCWQGDHETAACPLNKDVAVQTRGREPRGRANCSGPEFEFLDLGAEQTQDLATDHMFSHDGVRNITR